MLEPKGSTQMLRMIRLVRVVRTGGNNNEAVLVVAVAVRPQGDGRRP